MSVFSETFVHERFGEVSLKEESRTYVKEKW